MHSLSGCFDGMGCFMGADQGPRVASTMCCTDPQCWSLTLSELLYILLHAPCTATVRYYWSAGLQIGAVAPNATYTPYMYESQLQRWRSLRHGEPSPLGCVSGCTSIAQLTLYIIMLCVTALTPHWPSSR